jgi:uncharacterized protein
MTMIQTETVSPFHAGERQVQRHLGVEAIENWARKAIRPYMPEQHRAFHTAQPFLVAAARDAQGRPWATVLSGPDGFVTSPDRQSLEIDARPPSGDALDSALVPGVDIGLLGIELATRRRNRVNGKIAASGSGALVFAVDQSFGNCPQYITPRRWRREENANPGAPRSSTGLSSEQIRWITAADTFFIASGHRGADDDASFGMDASHRGGEAGFVRVEDSTRISFPDYAGNNHYNTIGNLIVDPRVGMLFVDFSTGSLLQLSGTASIDWDSDAVAREPGAQRLVTIEIEAVIELPGALSLRWDVEAEAVRSLRVIEKTRESADVTSFVLEARDGGALPDFEAGQHLPVEFSEVEQATPIRRTYSLSGAPSAGRYRISVKREPLGLASRHLHDRIEVGDFINAGKPAGDFVIPDTTSPMVLISAGVGITPMVGMLHALASPEPGREVLFLHGAIDGDHLPLAEEIRGIAGHATNVRVHTTLSRPGQKDHNGAGHQGVGRIDGALLTELNVEAAAHFMICGPLGFMSDIQSLLQDLEVPAEHIHTETFGPAKG